MTDRKPEVGGSFHCAGARCKPDDEGRDRDGENKEQSFRCQMSGARRETEAGI